MTDQLQLPEGFFEELHKTAKNNCVTLVFADSNYGDVVRNWITHARLTGAQNFVIIALDHKLFRELKTESVSCVQGDIPGSLNNLWRYRVFCLQAGLEFGFHVAHSDADAVWLRDPTAELLKDYKVDATFSQGTIWPTDVLASWGFVLCCGLFGFRSTINSRRLVKRWVTELDEDPDDQRSLNRLLLNMEISWPNGNPRILSFRDHDLRCFDTELIGLLNRSGASGEPPNLDQPMHIKLLPHALYQRIYEEHPSPAVRHLLSDDKTAESVKDVLLAAGCWVKELPGDNV